MEDVKVCFSKFRCQGSAEDVSEIVWSGGWRSVGSQEVYGINIIVRVDVDLWSGHILVIGIHADMQEWEACCVTCEIFLSMIDLFIEEAPDKASLTMRVSLCPSNFFTILKLDCRKGEEC